MLERCWYFHQTPSGNNGLALTDGRLREHGHHNLGTRLLIFKWTMSSYLIESSGSQLTRINRMRASVKLTLFTEELKNRVRVWVKSSRSSTYTWSLKRAPPKRWPFSPSLAPQGVFWIVTALKCIETLVSLCLKDADTFIKRPAGTMIRHWQTGVCENMVTMILGHDSWFLTELWAHTWLKLAAFNWPESIKWEPALSYFFKTEELRSRVRVWVKSTGLGFGSTFGHTPLAFSLSLVEGLVARALILDHQSGGHRRGGLSPHLWPRRALFE